MIKLPLSSAPAEPGKTRKCDVLDSCCVAVKQENSGSAPLPGISCPYAGGLKQEVKVICTSANNVKHRPCLHHV